MAELESKGTWFCRIAVLQQNPLFWVYAVVNCDTMDAGITIDFPDLALGDCDDPDEDGCELVAVPADLPVRDIGGRKYKFSIVNPKLTEEFKNAEKKAREVVAKAQMIMDISDLPRLNG